MAEAFERDGDVEIRPLFNFSYKCTIKNYINLVTILSPNDKVKANKFAIGPNNDIILQLYFCLKGPNCLDLSLHRISQKMQEVWFTDTTASILQPDGVTKRLILNFNVPRKISADQENAIIGSTSTHNTNTIFGQFSASGGQQVQVPPFVQASSRPIQINYSNSATERNVTVIIEGKVNGYSGTNDHLIQMPTTLGRDMKSLFKSAKFSDLQIIVGDVSYPAHKCILSARAPVFAKMFEHENTSENQENVITITDIPANIFEEVLQFLYTDTCPNVQEMAPELLYVAEKYDINALKIQCESVMLGNLSTENACDYFVKADRYNVDSLRSKSLNYIKDNLKFIMKTDGWKELKDSYHHLVLAILDVVAN